VSEELAGELQQVVRVAGFGAADFIDLAGKLVGGEEMLPLAVTTVRPAPPEGYGSPKIGGSRVPGGLARAFIDAFIAEKLRNLRVGVQAVEDGIIPNSCEVKPKRALSIFVPMLPAPQKYCS
jgi:hypothetical protein